MEKSWNKKKTEVGRWWTREEQQTEEEKNN